MTPKEIIEQATDELGLTMRAEFVPFSQSRNKDEKRKSLNWRITLSKDGQDFLTTDYMAGEGHCPSYRQTWSGGLTAGKREAVDKECETGLRHSINARGSAVPSAGRKPILPELADVLYSLSSDADAIDYGSFEEWADGFGYDADSRSAEKTYRACLETALKLRNAIGDDGLSRLREACQDY